MLLLWVEGLHSCPQVMWTTYRETVSQIVGADDGLVPFCGSRWDSRRKACHGWAPGGRT